MGTEEMNQDYENEFLSDLQGLESVSYTHLDVYKRQININHLNAVAIIYFKSNNILGIH